MKNNLTAVVAFYSCILLQGTIQSPLLAESFPFSLAQVASFDDTISYKVTAQTPILGYRFSSRAPMPQPSHLGFPDFTARSWTVEFAPNDELSILAGSISWSGLPARIASPARSSLSPFASIAGVRAGATIRPSWAAGREYFGIEWKTTYLSLISFASPTAPLEKPVWIQCTLGIPLKKDSRPALSLSFFSALAHRAASADDSWFLPEPSLPDRSILIPGAELAFDLGGFSGNLAGMANFGSFSPQKFALTGDLGYAGKVFRAGASYFLGDPSLITLDGTILTIRQSGCASCSIRLPLPGGPSDDIAAGVTFAVKRTSNLSMSEGGKTFFSGGGELKATLTHLRASVKGDRDDDATKISVKLGFPTLFTPDLALDLAGSVSFPRSQFSPETWSDGSASAKLKTGRIGPLSGDLQGIFTKAKPDSPMGIECIALFNLSFTDTLANWTVIGTLSGKPLKSECKGTLSIRADFP
jgi:hypothetical protein